MNNHNFLDLSNNFTVVVSVLGGMSEATHFAKIKPFEVAKELFTMFPPTSGHIFNPLPIKTVITQLVLTNMGEADDSSKNQQLGRFQYKGKNKVWPEKPIEDQIAAQVISMIWDRIGGKLNGSSFTFKSDNLQFSMRFDSVREKYIIG